MFQFGLTFNKDTCISNSSWKTRIKKENTREWKSLKDTVVEASKCFKLLKGRSFANVVIYSTLSPKLVYWTYNAFNAAQHTADNVITSISWTKMRESSSFSIKIGFSNLRSWINWYSLLITRSHCLLLAFSLKRSSWKNSFHSIWLFKKIKMTKSKMLPALS